MAGWLKNGPRGVIADSLIDAKLTTEAIENDLSNASANKEKKLNSTKSLKSLHYNAVIKELKNKSVKFVDKKGWEKIDAVEKKRGLQRGVERLKITDYNEMLKVAGVK